MRLFRRILPAALVFAGLSCAGTPTGTVSIVTGDEADAFSRTPAPSTLVVEIIAQDRTRRELSRTSLPTDTIDLGELPRTDVGAIGVTALDAAGRPLLKGESLYVQWGALETTSLEVFAQRLGETARLPRGPSQIDVTAAMMLVGRYVFAVSGNATFAYDLLSLRPLGNQPTLPRTPKSLATFELNAVAIDETGANVFDLTTGTGSELLAPTGGTYAEIAGGLTYAARDGTQYVVGGTRLSGGPSARVLVITTDGKTSFANLTAAREGACATWIEGRGLVIAGGDATAAGAEILAPGATQAAPLPFPPDPSKGCGATSLDVGHVAVFGGAGKDKGRVLDLACSTNCTAAEWVGTIPLVRAQAVTLAADAALVVGDDATGATHAFRATAAEAKEIPLRIPRRGARLVAAPTGASVIVGGGNGIEQYLE